MSELLEVVPSGTVGKQVFAANRPAVLKGVIVTAAASAVTVVVRDGNASGEVKLTLKQPVGSSTPFEFEGKRFDKGMHVKVTGTNGLAYLEIE